MTEIFSNNPFTLFQEWLDEARKTEVNDPDAMALATATADGKPSVRMVLLKDVSESGFKFHTNCESQKGTQLAENPQAALCFHWKTLRKQVRIEGAIETVSETEADEYFQNRPYERQIGAWASKQSRSLESRAQLEETIETLQNQYPRGVAVPRPQYWIGYRLKPSSIEFWLDNPDRLHDRFLFTKDTSNNWVKTRLYP